MARALSAILLLAGLAAAALLAKGARVPAGGPSPAAIDAVAQELDARLRETAASASSRAQTLADLPRLGVAVATDAATVRDLTDEELAFRPQPGETIEIAQRPVAGGAPTSLLRIPDGSPVVAPLATPGVHLLDGNGGALRVAAVVELRPRERADEIVGVVAVSRILDMKGVTSLLAPVGGGVVLETAAGPIAIGRPVDRSAGTSEVPIGRGQRHPNARLIAPAPVPGGWAPDRLAMAGAVAGLGLVAAVIFFLRGRRRGGGLPSVSPITAIVPPRRADRESGVRVGRYIVLRRLGSGGMADVYLARAEGEAGFERLVALKVMLDEFARSQKFVSHFLDEARLAPRLVHPNIVAVTDLGKEGDSYIIAMEYVDGADLARLVQSVAARGVQIPAGVALAIVRRVCDGLHFAHTAVDGDGHPLDLVHRDVKSANVFVARNGSVKVGDFGIAKIAGAGRTAKTEIGEVKGTAAYMAPEQRTGQDVDARADVYAVGAICYELLTGRTINLDLAMLAHLGREGWPHLAPPSSVRAELPTELDALVFRAMAFERDDRFASCEALEQAVAEVADRHGLTANDKLIARWLAGELELLPDAEEANAVIQSQA